jgi:uncharacterized Fe-S cluster protein YjdI
MEKIKEYSNGEVTVVWKPRSCIHSEICIKGLPDVFQPTEKPWIKVEAASTEELINQVKQCPSGALSHYMNNAKNDEPESSATRVEVLENGPLLVHGTLDITHKDGSKEIKDKTTAFCRCGLSNKKPYCDGTHKKENFQG